MNGRQSAAGAAGTAKSARTGIVWRAGVQAGLSLTSILALLVVPNGDAIAYLVLSVVAFRSPTGPVKALSLSWIVTMANPGLFATDWPQLRWLVLVAAFTSSFYWFLKQRRRLRPASALMIVFSLVAIASAILSYAPLSSALKATAFAGGVLAMLLVFEHREQLISSKLEEWFFVISAGVLLLSLPTYLVEAGFLTDGEGFQGILNQPQAFGVFVAPLLAWAVGLLLAGQRTPGVWIVAVSGVPALIATRSRGAFVASALAVLVVCVVMGVRALAAVASRKRSSIPVSLVAVIIAFPILFVFQAAVTDAAFEFFLKYEESTLAESFEQARGGLISQSLENFQSSPILGIGFGLPSDPEDLDISSSVLGIPLGAPIEKGFIGSAVLEETGVLGAGFLTLALATIALSVFRSAHLGLVALFVGALGTNVGEDTLLSLGGMGLYVWLMVGLAYGWTAKRQLSWHRQRQTKQPVMRRASGWQPR